MSHDSLKAAAGRERASMSSRSPANAAHGPTGRAMHGYQHLRQQLGDLPQPGKLQPGGLHRLVLHTGQRHPVGHDPVPAIRALRFRRARSGERLGKRSSVTFTFCWTPRMTTSGSTPTLRHGAMIRCSAVRSGRASGPAGRLGRAASWSGIAASCTPVRPRELQAHGVHRAGDEGVGTWQRLHRRQRPAKLADDDSAEYPPRSTGVLSASLASGSTPTSIDIVTDRTTEYDIQSFEPSFSAIRIGDEIIKYTTVATITGGVRLSGLTFGGFDQYSTTRSDHDAGYKVQKCAYFKAMRPIDVFVVLLEDGAGIDSSYIPYSEWESEAVTWIAGFRLTRLVCEPEGVKKHFDELMPQTSTWAIWWDEESSLIRYRCVRPPDIDEVVGTMTDDANIISGSVQCLDDSDRLLNEVYVTMGQVDPTKKLDDVGNYRTGFVTVNADSQGANETNSRKSKTIWGRWHPTSNMAELQAVVDRMLLNRSFVPIRIEFEVDRKDDSVKTGRLHRLGDICRPRCLRVAA